MHLRPREQRTYTIFVGYQQYSEDLQEHEGIRRILLLFGREVTN